MKDKKHILCTDTSLYIEAESKTNRENIKYLVILAMIMILCDFLNEINLFEVHPTVMRIGIACGTLCYLFPVFILSRSLKLFSRNFAEIGYRSWHKYLIIVFTWLGTAAACIMFTHHTVILMAIPIMIMSQYRDTKKLVPICLLSGTICVLLGVYGGYFWGCFDANLLHIAVTDENIGDLAMRARMATSDRMVELLTHYALPRELVVLSLVLLASKISQHNDQMLKRQAQLQSAVEREMQHTNDIQWQIIDGMANLIENRDSSTGEHVKRTSFYVNEIAHTLQTNPHIGSILSDKECNTIVKAAPLHDIGKIVVADRILQKPGKLTPDEYEEIKLHASEGSQVIKNVLGNVEDDDFLRVATEIAGGHHERWDGNGYPSGLKGAEIPLSARIMAVADVFDALVSKRVYKEPIAPEEAFAIIESESGKQFDPEVVSAFISLKPEIFSYLKKAKV